MIETDENRVQRFIAEGGGISADQAVIRGMWNLQESLGHTVVSGPIGSGMTTSHLFNAIRLTLPPERRHEIEVIRFKKSRGYRKHIRRRKAAEA